MQLIEGSLTLKPLLKWAGGKRHIASKIEKYFPSNWREGVYFEPFFGGGAIFFHLEPKESIISDLNPRLIGFYKILKKQSDELLVEIKRISTKFNKVEESQKKNFYLDVREKYNNSENNSLESASLLYILNKLCFNGLYRENSKGLFNVPFGDKKVFPEIPIESFKKNSRLLKNTKIINSDFEKAIAEAKNGDIIYFDPPYVPVNQTSNFTAYQASGFPLDAQERLAKKMVELAKSNVRAICSNSDTEITREIFKGLNQFQISAPRMVSAKSSGRGTVTELVITNFHAE